MKEKYRVLIVDENEEILRLLRELLENEAYQVETTQSAVIAIEKVKSDKYHVLLIDIDNQEMNGIELLKEIKNYDALAQIIMMTELSSMDKILNSLEYGANDYITKPFVNTENVLKVIDYSVEKLERWRDAFVELVK